ncbi:MAG: endonuclease [Candidatus Nanoarchaeia archaeon]
MDKDILEIYNILLEKFGNQGWWPVTDKRNRQFEIVVGAILTQNTSWKNVEKAIKKLKENNMLTKQAIINTDTKQLAKLIRSSGYYKQKAKKLREFANFKKEITRENLLSIWGIGDETADSILLYAYNEPYFVIDAYTKRIFQRLGYKQSTYKELQELFTKNLPKDIKIYKEYHALLVRLAKENCKKIPECKTCVLRKKCSYML